MLDTSVDEKLRLQLLKEEQKLRKKQPSAWTTQKYRRYANFGAAKKKDEKEQVASYASKDFVVEKRPAAIAVDEDSLEAMFESARPKE